MRNLTTAEVLTDTQTFIADQTAALRARMLTWLNLAMQNIMNEPREWEFMKTQTTVTLTASSFPFPSDFGDFILLKAGDICFTKNDILATEEIAIGTIPGIGIDEANQTITIYPPSTETTATLYYKKTLPDMGYSDSTTPTVFPVEFKPIFVRYLITLNNEFDAEDSTVLSLQLSSAEIKTMKEIDNRRKAGNKVNRHGYSRTTR